MTSALDITQAVNPPRAAFLDYPLGHTTGKPNDAMLQRKILIDAFDAFGSLTTPGAVKILPHKWDDDEAWKALERAKDDDRMERDDTPRYQSEEDRQLAEADRMTVGQKPYE